MKPIYFWPFKGVITYIISFITSTPWKINGWNLQITQFERKMIFSPNLQGIMLQPLIFRGLRGTNTRRIARYILSPKRFHQLGREESLRFLPVEEEYDEAPGRDQTWWVFRRFPFGGIYLCICCCSDSKVKLCKSSWKLHSYPREPRKKNSKLLSMK